LYELLRGAWLCHGTTLRSWDAQAMGAHRLHGRPGLHRRERAAHTPQNWGARSSSFCPFSPARRMQVTITQRAALLRYHAAELRLLDGEGAWQLRAIDHGGGGNGGAADGAESAGGNGAVEDLAPTKGAA